MTNRTEVAEREARRDRWVKIAMLMSTTSAVACVAMLVVTLSALRREPEVVASDIGRSSARAIAERRGEGPPSSADELPAARLGRPFLVSSRGGDEDEPSSERVEVPLKQRQAGLRIDAPVTPEIAELAARLHLVPSALVKVAGADGTVSPAVVARLERAAEAGKGLGSKLGLDPGNSQVFGDLFLDQSLSMIDAETREAGSDPDVIDSITQNTLDGIRAVAGDRGAEEAERLLRELR